MRQCAHPVLGNDDCRVKIEAAHGILNRGENVGKVVLTVECIQKIRLA